MESSKLSAMYCDCYDLKGHFYKMTMTFTVAQ